MYLLQVFGQPGQLGPLVQQVVDMGTLQLQEIVALQLSALENQSNMTSVLCQDVKVSICNLTTCPSKYEYCQYVQVSVSTLSACPIQCLYHVSMSKLVSVRMSK